MGKYVIIFNRGFCTLNEYINKERSNKYAGAKLKKQETDFVTLFCKNKFKLEKKVNIVFTWLEDTDHAKDPDNVSYAKKFILDGLVKAGVLQNDTYKQIQGFKDIFCYKKGQSRAVKVEFIEVEDECKRTS